MIILSNTAWFHFIMLYFIFLHLYSGPEWSSGRLPSSSAKPTQPQVTPTTIHEVRRRSAFNGFQSEDDAILGWHQFLQRSSCDPFEFSRSCLLSLGQRCCLWVWKRSWLPYSDCWSAQPRLNGAGPSSKLGSEAGKGQLEAANGDFVITHLPQCAYCMIFPCSMWDSGHM